MCKLGLKIPRVTTLFMSLVASPWIWKSASNDGVKEIDENESIDLK